MDHTPLSEPTALSEHRFPCEQCGSDLRFDPTSKQLSCDHCGYSAQLTEGAPHSIQELDLRDALRRDIPDVEAEETRVLTCPNCAAQTEFDAERHAHECPFCATPVVTDTGTHRHFKPKGLVPFVFTEKQARSAMTAWLGRLWFAPNGLNEYARKGRKMSGIYVPYWTFDADTKTQYRGQRGEIYYTEHTVVVNGERKKRRKQHIRWHSAQGRVARFFDDVLVLASRGLPKRYTQSLAPWDLSQLEPYTPEFLAGFRAEGYTIELPEGFSEAREYMDRVILRDVKFDIGGDRQRVTDLDTDVRDMTFKHILLPVWLAAYKYRGKTYRFVVNGQTGQVEGARPYSVWKITFAVIIGLIFAIAIGYIAAQSQ